MCCCGYVGSPSYLGGAPLDDRARASWLRQLCQSHAHGPKAALAPCRSWPRSQTGAPCASAGCPMVASTSASAFASGSAIRSWSTFRAWPTFEVWSAFDARSGSIAMVMLPASACVGCWPKYHHHQLAIKVPAIYRRCVLASDEWTTGELGQNRFSLCP